MTRDDIGGPLLLTYTTMSLCQISLLLHVHSGHAFVLPAMLDSRPQSVHADTRQSGQLSTIAIPGRRKQGTSGHNRAPGYGQVAVTSTHIPGLQPVDSPPSHAGLLSCLQLRVQSCAIPTTTGLYGWQGCSGHTALGRAQSPKSRVSAAQQDPLHSGKRTWDCTGVRGLDLPKQQSVSPSQCAKCARALGLCYTGQDGDPASPQPTWPLPRDSPTTGDMLTSLCLH